MDRLQKLYFDKLLIEDLRAYYKVCADKLALKDMRDGNDVSYVKENERVFNFMLTEIEDTFGEKTKKAPKKSRAI